jgi:hypothetical protein
MIGKLSTVFLCLVLGVGLIACKKDEHHNHAEEEHGEGDHEHESPSGASFKPGKGVILTEETRKILGVEVVDVAEQKLPKEFRFSMQVFGEKHHHALSSTDHSGCDVHGSGLVTAFEAASIKPGQPVQLLRVTNIMATGVVLNVQKALALGEAEIVVGISNAATVLKPGEFLPARITVASQESVVVVPVSAVLRTSEGTFVYAVNGDAYIRTAVKVGSQASGLAEILDGLLAGDQVVTKPVETLWLIELRATKGGGHSH